MSLRNHQNRLRRMAQQASPAVTRALYVAGQLIENTAEGSITAGAVSGANHVPSAPGSPPNEDTGTLRRGIETRIGGPNLVVVESKAPYSAALEFGTSRMAARPFMQPATEMNRDEVVRKVGAAMNIIIRRG